MTITSEQLRNASRFGTPVRADTLRKVADQQDALVDALRKIEEINLEARGAKTAVKSIARKLLRAHGRSV